MQSGASVDNPGLSIWPFVYFAHLTSDPVAMAQLIMFGNVLALWGFALWVWRCWPEAEPPRSGSGGAGPLDDGNQGGNPGIVGGDGNQGGTNGGGDSGGQGGSGGGDDQGGPVGDG